MSSALDVTRPTALVAPDPNLPVGATFDQMMTLAQTIHKSGMFGHKNPESVFVSMLKGRELGVPATVALSMIHVINGKPTASGELMLSLVERDYGRGAMYIDLAECTNDRAVIRYRDPQTGEHKVYEYTIQMAELAELTKGPNSGNWKKYPGNMLRWRAVSNVAKAVFPASVGGLYTPEEMGADVAFDDDGNVIDVTVPETSPRSGMAGLAPTERQFAKLFATAKERGWHKDQIEGRAAAINSAVHDEGLNALDREEMSALIDAVITERPWVDPRQQAMHLDARDVADGEYRDVDADAPQEADTPAAPARSLDDQRLLDWAECQDRLDAARTAKEVNEAWKQTINTGFGQDAELRALYDRRIAEFYRG